jgi:ATP-dependent exoDNAse (exonuclease V) beta subunit
MANVRKLMRMAREFEADEGRDLRAFIDFVAERDLIQSREGEAPLEAEQLDAVRLMTIHRAKGLEFPVVCVADLGKDGREDHGALRISADGSLGLRLASIGGGTFNTAELERIREEQRMADEAEERRIFYVAATRAQEHLLLSGATDLVKRPPPSALCEPMRWVWRAFCPDLPAEGATGIAASSYEGRPVPVRWTTCTPDTLEELLSAADRSPTLPAPATTESYETPPLELGAIAAPRALPVSRLSYSGLQSYKRCGYRFYLERVLRLPGGDALAPGRRPRARGERGVEAELELGAGPRGIAEPRAADELNPLLRGTIVHELLERLDFARPRVPSEQETVAAIERHGAHPRPEDVSDLRDMVERFVASPLCERLGRARRVSAELPFAFTITPPQTRRRSVLVNGVVDVHAIEAEGTLIVDYKSDPLEERTPAELVEGEYTVQRLVYALAALRSGADRAEVAYVLLERPDEPVVTSYDAAQADELESELLQLASGVVEGQFEPTDQPHAELCANCPGQPALCTWGPERTLAR